MDQDILTCSVVNFKVHPRNKEKNIQHILEYSRCAARSGSQLILFPELCVSGYGVFCNPESTIKEKQSFAETVDSEFLEPFVETAIQESIIIVFGIARKKGDKFYNSIVSITPQGEVSIYDKIHPFEKENEFFDKGNEPGILKTPWGNVGLAICYDTYQFPELIRYYVSQGCRIILNSTALYEDTKTNNGRASFDNYYMKSIEYHVMCNGIYIASSNLTGQDEMGYFGGASGIFGPKIVSFIEGECCTLAGGLGFTQAGIATTTIDLSMAPGNVFCENPYSGSSDYRGDLYKKFYEK